MNECRHDPRAFQDHRRSGNGRVARHFVSVAPSTDLAIAVSFMSGVADGGQHQPQFRRTRRRGSILHISAMQPFLERGRLPALITNERCDNGEARLRPCAPRAAARARRA